MRTFATLIIEVAAQPEPSDGNWPLIPLGTHYGRGMDYSVQTETLEVQFVIGDDGKPASYSGAAKGTRVQHLKDGLRPVGNYVMSISQAHLDAAPGLQELVSRMQEIARERWAELRKEGTEGRSWSGDETGGG